MNGSEARRKLHALLLKGSLALSGHARLRMAERKFTTQDIMRALSGGVMCDGPNTLTHIKGFECVMRTHLNDGRILEVPIIVDENEKRIIVKSAVRKAK